MSEFRNKLRPTVSVILPVYNESRYIEQTIASILAQETSEFELEVLAIEGKSTDGSAQIIRAMSDKDPRIRLLTNKQVRTPFAFNQGLREARGEYVCILGSHNVYPRDYIATCLREMLTHNAAACSGRTISKSADDSWVAKMACWVMGHPFGSSPRSFRTQPEGFVDSVPYPVMKKQPLLNLGGYNERLLRNQDNDMNQRLRAAGYNLYCTWKTHCEYHTPIDLKSLLKYAFRNGYWNIVSLTHNALSMSMRHFVPLFFVLTLSIAAVGTAVGNLALPQYRLVLMAPLPVLLSIHLAAGMVAAIQLFMQKRDWRTICLPPLFLAFHVSYGVGSVWALTRGFLSYIFRGSWDYN